MAETAIVNVAQGALRGRKITSTVTGKCFYSFQGIPYAKPPLGRFRFKAPHAPEPWTGIRDAQKEGNVCAQMDMLSQCYIGDEDCLFINVFTSQLPGVTKSAGDLKKAVMVFIHGGGFAAGSGNTDLYGPDHLVGQDVVLVTFNYRLGPLGFLTTDDREIPGNAGMKDQIAALKWVKQNIARFGGDPLNVTIFGESAGGASVHFLVLSPLAKGLFQRAISQSGCALNSWAYSSSGRSRTLSLAESLGCTSNDSKAVLAFLRNIPTQQLVENVTKAITPEEKRRGTLMLLFVPTCDGLFRHGEEVLLPAVPIDIIMSGKYNRVPYILGVNTCEGMLVLKDILAHPKVIPVLDKDMQGLLPEDLYPQIDTAQAVEAARKMKQFYFGDQSFTEDTMVQYSQLQSDLLFVYKVYETVRQQSKHTNASYPLYVYQFAFDGELGMFKQLLGLGELPGVCHADELGYLFNIGLVQQHVKPDSDEAKMRALMVRMWTNFAKTGKPGSAEVPWEPATPTKVNYLFIDKVPSMRTDLEKKNVQFWDELYHSAGTEFMSKV